MVDIYDMNKFIEASKKERYLLKQLLPQIYPDHQITITPEDSYDTYDALAIKYNDDGIKLYTHIIEVKIRSKSYPKLVYETKKHKQLTKIKNMDHRNSIVYISSDPSGTYIFNINDITLPKPIEMIMNEATMTSLITKITKKVFLIDSELAKYNPYRFQEHEYEHSKIALKSTLKDKKDMFDGI